MVLAQSSTNAPRLLSQVKASTHSPLLKGLHTTSHTPKQVAFRMERYHYPRYEPHVRAPPWVGYQNGKLCRFWALAGCALEERRKPSEQRCALMRVAVPRRRGPAGLRSSIANMMTHSAILSSPLCCKPFRSMVLQSRQRGQPL